MGRKAGRVPFVSLGRFRFFFCVGQALRNVEQALRNVEQMLRNVEQALLNVERTLLNVERTLLNVEQVLLNVEQVLLNMERVLLNVERMLLGVDSSGKGCRGDKNKKKPLNYAPNAEHNLNDFAEDVASPYWLPLI